MVQCAPQQLCRMPFASLLVFSERRLPAPYGHTTNEFDVKYTVPRCILCWAKEFSGTASILVKEPVVKLVFRVQLFRKTHFPVRLLVPSSWRTRD
jgi:hypothetical protein